MIEENNEIIKIEDTSPEIIYQQDKAVVDIQIATAKAYPRNIKRSTENALAIVTLSAETAATCTYSVPRGGKAITGASVHLAKILAQCWGNLRIEAKVIGFDSKYVTSQAIAFDLENNLAIKVEVKRCILQNEYKNEGGKPVRTGRMVRMNDDMITVTGNASNSIALRNAVLSVIPKGIVEKVYAAAKQTITGDISDKTKLIARRKQVFDGLKDTYSITENEILFAVGKAAIDHITADDLVVLIGIGQAIKDGDTTVDIAFKGAKSPNENVPNKIDHAAERVELMIKDAKTPEELEKIKPHVAPEQMDIFTQKESTLKKTKK